MKSRDEIENPIEPSEAEPEPEAADQRPARRHVSTALAGQGAPNRGPSHIPAVAAEIDAPLARSFAEMIGQGELVRRLTGLVELARRRAETLGHILLLGPDGCGKSTTAYLIARELGVNLNRTEASRIERAGNLAAIINDLDEGDVLLIENVDRLQKALVEVLLPGLRDFELNN